MNMTPFFSAAHTVLNNNQRRRQTSFNHQTLNNHQIRNDTSNDETGDDNKQPHFYYENDIDDVGY